MWLENIQNTKYKNTLDNTLEKYRNTLEEYTREIHLRNTVEEHSAVRRESSSKKPSQFVLCHPLHLIRLVPYLRMVRRRMWRRRMDTNISLRTNLSTLCHTFANEEEEDDGVYKIVVPWVPWALCEKPFCPKTGRCCCLFAVMAIPIPIFPLHSREVL